VQKNWAGRTVTLLLLLFANVPLVALTIISSNGTPSDGAALFPGQAIAQQFTLTAPFRNVRISASLQSGSPPQSGTAYLVTQIGPGTTATHQVARASFSPPTGSALTLTDVLVFSGLTLQPGSYTIVYTAPDNPQGSISTSASVTYSTVPEASVGVKCHTSSSTYNNSFPPASPFNCYSGPTSTRTFFTVSGVPAGTSAPVANFTSAPSSPKTGDAVQFTDSSTGAPTSWSWSFGDGATSTVQNPPHTFQTAGKFSVKLTASNAGGSNSATKSITVAAKPSAPVAQFDWSPKPPKAGVDVQFTDQSTGNPTSWSWDFGGGEKSTSRNPRHKFAQEGSYPVKLTVKNSLGSDSVTNTVVVGAAGTVILTILNPEPDWGHSQPPATAAQAEGVGEACKGAATDGDAWLIARAETGAAAQVTFALAGSNGAFQAGKLYALGSSSPVNTVTVSTIPVGGGRHAAHVIYEAPPVFPTAAGAEWTFDLTAQATGDGTDAQAARSITLIRPPLILVHGLKSSGVTWDDSPYQSRYRVSRMGSGQGLSHRLNVFRPSYDGTQSFEYNARVVPNQIADALDALNNAGYAGRRADVVGHSMGGVLARTLAGSPWYLDNIYRLITLDSPHQGSPIATVLSTGTLLSSLLERASGILGMTWMPALRNLSGIEISLPEAHVWTHLIAGVDGQDSVARNVCWTRGDPELSFWQWAANLQLDSLLLTAFSFEEHDVVVSRRSQLAGFSGSEQFVTVMQGWEGVHLCNTRSLAYALRVIQLLNQDPSKGAFAESLPGVNEFRTPQVARHTAVVPLAESEGVVVSSPTSGSTFAPGDQIPVVVGINGLDVESVAVLTRGDVQFDSSPPYEVTLTASEHQLGAADILAMARLVDGTVVASVPLRISVASDETFSGLTLAPNDDLVLRVRRRIPLEVIGTVARTGKPLLLRSEDLTISYSSLGIAEVVDGELVGLRPGGVTITFTKNTASVEMRVIVTEPERSQRRRTVRH
jgi:PKD repeat protein